MYKINQLSKISGLTVKALRYYDDENILKPSFRDAQNQYRYYSETDLEKAYVIKFMRSLEFSIMEIKDILEHIENPDDLSYVLQEKIKHIENKISKEKELIQKISQNINYVQESTIDNHYFIETVEIKERLVASIKFTGKYNDLDTYVPLLYKAVKNLKEGKHFNCYFDDAYSENALIELCIPIKKTIEHKDITCKNLPVIRALQTIHYGSYDTLYLAYKALIDYANTHQIKIITPSRELYIKSPGMIFKGNPKHYITKILLPFEVF